MKPSCALAELHADAESVGVQVDPQLDLHALRSLALAAFAAFRNCLPNKGEEFDRESPGSLGDEMFDWQTKWPDPGSTPCDGGQPGPVGREIEKQWRAAYTAYLDSETHTRMLQAGKYVHCVCAVPSLEPARCLVCGC